jgi:hypothetical protein
MKSNMIGCRESRKITAKRAISSKNKSPLLAGIIISGGSKFTF